MLLSHAEKMLRLRRAVRFANDPEEPAKLKATLIAAIKATLPKVIAELPEDQKDAMQAHTDALNRRFIAADGTACVTNFRLHRVKESLANVSWNHLDTGPQNTVIHGRYCVCIVEFLHDKPGHSSSRTELDEILWRKLKYKRPTSRTFKDIFSHRPEHRLFWRDVMCNKPKSQRFSLKII